MRVVFLLPYRCDAGAPDRKGQLATFLATVPEMLQGARVECRYIVCEQSADARRFNKGAVVNACFKTTTWDAEDLVCVHDIDLIPEADIIGEYTKALNADTVRHIGSAFKRYAGCKKYMGGILLMRASDFAAVNGFPNDFEGWGGEDDVLGKRITHRFAVERSRGTLVDLERLVSPRDKLAQLIQYKSMGKGKATKKRGYMGARLYERGISDVEFSVLESKHCATATRLTVHLTAGAA